MSTEGEWKTLAECFVDAGSKFPFRVFLQYGRCEREIIGYAFASENKFKYAAPYRWDHGHELARLLCDEPCVATESPPPATHCSCSFMRMELVRDLACHYPHKESV